MSESLAGHGSNTVPHGCTMESPLTGLGLDKSRTTWHVNHMLDAAVHDLVMHAIHLDSAGYPAAEGGGATLPPVDTVDGTGTCRRGGPDGAGSARPLGTSCGVATRFTGGAVRPDSLFE